MSGLASVPGTYLRLPGVKLTIVFLGLSYRGNYKNVSDSLRGQIIDERCTDVCFSHASSEVAHNLSKLIDRYVLNDLR